MTASPWGTSITLQSEVFPIMLKRCVFNKESNNNEPKLDPCGTPEPVNSTICIDFYFENDLWKQVRQCQFLSFRIIQHVFGFRRPNLSISSEPMTGVETTATAHTQVNFPLWRCK